MWRKVRRWTARLVFGLVLLALVASLVFNALTQPKEAGPRDAGVPGQWVAVGGSLTHYETAGNGKTPIVLLHGFGSWSFTWRPVLAALGTDPRFTVYALDMRGFGFTERPADALYDASGFAAHVEEFIDTLKLDRPILVGNSLGGDVALRVALDRPDRVRALVLADAAIGQSSPLVSRAVTRLGLVPPFHRTLLRAGARWALRDRVEADYFDPKSVRVDEIVANLRRPLDQRGAEDALLSMLRTADQPLSPARVATVRVPTLVVWGENDRITPLDAGRRLASQIPGARLVTYPRTGHHPQEEARERFASDVLRFADQVAPR